MGRHVAGITAKDDSTTEDKNNYKQELNHALFSRDFSASFQLSESL